MSTDSQQIVAKAWNFAHVLRDDGLSYMSYVEQITFLLFLKMADEQARPPYNRPPIVPERLRLGRACKAKEGDALEAHYRHTSSSISRQPDEGCSAPSSRRPSPPSRTPPRSGRLIVDLIDPEKFG